jgi:hypothetical protein
VVDAYDILMSLMPEEEIPAKNTDKWYNKIVLPNGGR